MFHYKLHRKTDKSNNFSSKDFKTVLLNDGGGVQSRGQKVINHVSIISKFQIYSFKRKWKPFKRYRDLSSSFHSKRMTFYSVSQLFFIFFFPQSSWKEKKKKKNKGLCVDLSGTILLKKAPMYMSIKKGFSNVRKTVESWN